MKRMRWAAYYLVLPLAFVSLLFFFEEGFQWSFLKFLQHVRP